MALFGKDNQRESGDATETIIGSSVKVDGNFVGKGNISIEGKVTGSMKTNQNIRIAQNAVVKANIEAQTIFIAGEVHGTVKANDRLELAETARVHGDVETKVITIGAGALLNGKCIMLGDSPQEQPVLDERQNKDRLTRFARPQRKQDLPS